MKSLYATKTEQLGPVRRYWRLSSGGRSFFTTAQVQFTTEYSNRYIEGRLSPCTIKSTFTPSSVGLKHTAISFVALIASITVRSFNPLRNDVGKADTSLPDTFLYQRLISWLCWKNGRLHRFNNCRLVLGFSQLHHAHSFSVLLWRLGGLLRCIKTFERCCCMIGRIKTSLTVHFRTVALVIKHCFIESPKKGFL